MAAVRLVIGVPDDEPCRKFVTVVAVHQPQYLPYLGFFHKLSQCDVFVALDDAQFQKNGLQNRNKIRSSSKDGWQWLTVPVIHRLEQRINEVQINPRVPWQRKHWGSLVANYARAPYFEKYGESLQSVLENGFADLFSLDMALVRWVAEALNIATPMVLSSSLDIHSSGTERLVEICLALGASGYLSGPGGRRYMDLDLFERSGVAVIWQKFEPPVYQQVFPKRGFVPNLSVIDFLLSCGEGALRYLE